jgi:ATP-dependent Clp protease, protease subunit
MTQQPQQPTAQQPTAPPAPPSIVYVSFSAEIVPATTESLIAVMANCANQQVPHVYLMLSTPGGSVMNGLNLYHVLRGMPFKLTTHNVGNVDSIGNAVFLAGGERFACPDATFMFHGVGVGTNPGERLEEKNLNEKLDSLRADQQRIGKIIADRTKINPADAADLFLQAKTKDAAYAAGCGIIDQIKDVQIPAGSTVVSLVFQRQPI